MKKPISVLAIFLAIFSLTGCRQQAADSAAETANGDNTSFVAGTDPGSLARQDLDDRQVPTGITRNTSPEEIVTAFLAALRQGDNGIAEALLTRRAYEETRQRGLQVQPVGSPGATCKIGITEYLGPHKNGAHVKTTWTEAAGVVGSSYDIVWALRRQDAGWRVAGMGAQLVPGQKVVYLNFEDPDDMLAKLREADDAVLAGQATDNGIREAQNPTITGSLQR
jgi:hypothetical protein